MTQVMLGGSRYARLARALKVVDHDGPADAGLVVEELGIRELAVEAVVARHPVTGVGFPGVHEQLCAVEVPVGGGIGPRTLC
jgi:hypothetical protein